MDRKSAFEMPRGVSIRTFKTEERLQVAFSYRSVECRELLPPQKITKTAVQLAGGLRMEILRKIETGSFAYRDYFPNSSKLAQFESTAGKRVVNLGKLMDAQRETYERQEDNNKLSASTVAAYVKALVSEKMKQWRDRDVSDVTPSELRAWISGFDTTAKTARNLIIPLRSIFKDALNDDLITFDPFERIHLTKLLDQTARDSEYCIDPFNEEERAKLIKACRPDERPMVEFWFQTGLRPSELHALRWSRIDLEGRRIMIDQVQVEKKKQNRTKTAAGMRWVSLSDEAVAALEAQKPVTLLAGQEVWHNPRQGKAWVTADQMRKTLWVPLCARAEIPYRNPYQVRHTFASSRLTKGENPWFLAEQMGHVDVSMVFTTYGKFIAKDFKKPAMQPNLKVV